jgi:mannose-6-phosphate isomerase-like protein (cupin superfamily)
VKFRAAGAHATLARVSRRVEKPWGHEEIWAETPRYLGKILAIRAGKRLSLQLHRKKDEAIYVLRGTLRLTLENDAGELEVTDLGPGASRRIVPGRRHRFEAVSDCELCEVSSPEIDDVVRLEDDYGRAPASS